MSKATILLNRLNRTYARLHTTYENLFWRVYMGEHALSERMDQAQHARNAFCADPKNLAAVRLLLADATPEEREHLSAWELFFAKYEVPEKVRKIRERATALESVIFKKQNTRTEGYTDPSTKTFVPASLNTLTSLIQTHDDEKVRKAAYEAKEALAQDCVDEYVTLVSLRNEYARGLGYEDFFAYKLHHEEGMTKQELADLFDAVYEKTKNVFVETRTMEAHMPGLRKPWNFSYLLASDFTKREEPYFSIEEALSRWGRSFAALGIDYQGGSITLDLLDRKGKHSNGFCHWPTLVRYENGVRQPGSSNFTCNMVAGKVGEGAKGMRVLFHEGGHAAHYLNSTQTQVCLNHEYPPSSTAWAETQSMFLDTLSSSIDWKVRYATDSEGHAYPLSLYVEKVTALRTLSPRMMLTIMMVSEFERRVYASKNLTAEKVLRFAREAHKKYTDQAPSSLWVLSIIHVYGWESSCAYHSYGLAQMAVAQWREYFYKKYGYIVDNPQVGKEMQQVWELAASKTFPELVKRATGKKLSAAAYIRDVTASVATSVRTAKEKIERLERVPKHRGVVTLNAAIRMVHGKKTIATNADSFEDMAERYAAWLRT